MFVNVVFFIYIFFPLSLFCFPSSFVSFNFFPCFAHVSSSPELALCKQNAMTHRSAMSKNIKVNWCNSVHRRHRARACVCVCVCVPRSRA